MFPFPTPEGPPGPWQSGRGAHQHHARGHHPHERGAHGRDRGFGPGPGAFGFGGPGGPEAGDPEARGFGPRGFGPRGFGPRGFGPGGPGGPEGGWRGRRGGGRGRAPRGDVRTAVLLLLAEQPMHGYQLMQAIAERSGGRWTPSPGAVYPTISALEDEGLATVTADAGRKLVTLTEAGRAHVEERRAAWPDPFGGARGGAAGPDLRSLLEEVHGAVRQVGRTGSEAQLAAAAAVLADARRSLYLLLADGAEGPGATDTAETPGTPGV
ncbi:PadR family transcriptional regulator [Geodermatophilus maliterrae]|uniref:PadR family transcriptional regulator n=1 Tax=Geodermatophilus maliterrae TaxID=3162531 RepID=A0ABV3XJ61_9ACTN